MDPYLGGATWMAGYLATGACSPGGDSSLSCHVVSITNLSLNVSFVQYWKQSS